ncbi:hypothetical protein N7517_002954 [Penicillium concentricum]|uniref:DUF7702 domain-containing protein n=1 Tax=Penicillium concentricum TaxID=293559 RepID=A0A9W9VJZ8_9EURO|nr:uncharacterized protein N7517_002954 [Penicillium concentricum]KAJ5385043.1 hypothetical protein N7517_002954 [Penicillium concentricum]
MTFNLLSRSLNSPISTGKRNIAIAEIIIYSLIHIAQFSTRCMQEWRYWHHNKNKSTRRCVFYSWWSMVGLLSQIRIAGSALVLASSHPEKPMLIAESVLQSVGLSPLLFEVSLVLLRCGQSGETGPGNWKWTKRTRFALHFFRFPIFIAIILAVVGGCINMRALGEAGSIVLIVTFAYVCGLVGWLAVKSRSILPKSGHHAVLLTLLTLPFLLVRVIYFLLLEYGPPKFNPATGNISIFVGMGLLMETIIVILLLAARAVAEPVLPSIISKRIVYDDLESTRN